MEYGRLEHTDEFFPPEYVSGGQIQLHLGDNFMRDVNSLQYSLIEKTLPIHGYNSYTYDAVIRGQRTISGSFTINFHDPNSLEGDLYQLLYGSKSKASTNNVLSAEERQELANRLMKINSNSKEAIAIKQRLRADWHNNQEEKSVNFGESNIISLRKKRPYFFNEREDILRKGLNLKIGFDVNWQYEKEIVGLQIVGVQSGFDSNGTPVSERYSFIAKDIINN